MEEEEEDELLELSVETEEGSVEGGAELGREEGEAEDVAEEESGRRGRGGREEREWSDGVGGAVGAGVSLRRSESLSSLIGMESREVL